MSSSLVARAESKLELWKLIESTGGELTPELEAWLSKVDRDLAQKVDAYKFALDELDRESEKIRLESQKLAQASRSLDRMHDALFSRIKYVMQRMQADELLGDTYRFKVSNGASKLCIDDESQIPPEYKIIKTVCEIDKEKLKKDLESGPVPGAHLEDVKQLRTYINKGASR